MTPMERVILAGRRDPYVNDQRFLSTMEELENLTQTAGGDVVAAVTQTRPTVDPATYIGSGKVQEIERLCREFEADAVIFNDELSPSQQTNLATRLDVKVLDRTQLILDIFAGRAHSREGRLQVELAQLNYLLPRLTGLGLSLSRLGGGIGTRGPGETQLETDRRHIRRRIGDIKKQLETVVRHREQYRQRRRRNGQFQVAIVGYTNAGKSTLFNRLTTAETLEENKLFATLDPLTRRFRTPRGFQLLMSDTVGFIQKLPTTLVAAFRSTLEETREADLILHVIDISDPDHESRMETVDKLLKELGAGEVPRLILYNKIDRRSERLEPLLPLDGLLISAFDPLDIQKVSKAIESCIIKQSLPYTVMVSPSDGRLLSRLTEETLVMDKVWDESKQAYYCHGFVWSGSALRDRLTTQETEEDDV